MAASAGSGLVFLLESETRVYKKWSDGADVAWAAGEMCRGRGRGWRPHWRGESLALRNLDRLVFDIMKEKTGVLF